MASFAVTSLGFASQALPMRAGARMLAENYTLCDIGVNLCDEMYTGVYNDKQRHPHDLQLVLERSRSLNISKIISTAGSVEDTRLTLKILSTPVVSSPTASRESAEAGANLTFAEAYGLYMTAGVHPTRADLFQDDSAPATASEVEEAETETEMETEGKCLSLSVSELEAIGGTTGSHTIDRLVHLIYTANSAASSAVTPSSSSSSSSSSVAAAALVHSPRSSHKTVVALGECGLDYARLMFSSKEQQMDGFLKQLRVAQHPLVDLPLFLHSRAAEGDFLRVMKENRDLYARRGGVVHSYDGTVEEMLELCELGLYIGINGCSLRTIESHEVVKAIPKDKLLLETDAPWCGIKRTHPSYQYVQTLFPPEGVKKKEKWEEGLLVKDRNEPCYLHQVAEVVAALRDVPVEELAEQCWVNSEKLFFFDE